MKKNLMNLFMLCALTAPLYLGSCAPKAENKQVCENEEKTEVKEETETAEIKKTRKPRTTKADNNKTDKKD